MARATTANECAAIETTARRKLENAALKRFLAIVDLLGLAFGKVIADYRAQGDPVAREMATIAELRAQLAAAQRKIAVLQQRLDRMPPRKRPHCDPRSRFDILEVRALLHESAAATAEWCRVSANTILRWEDELKKHPERRTIGSLLRALPPVRRFADAERRLVQWMDCMGFAGSRTIAQTLARAGRAISTRTVSRIRKERTLPTPAPTTTTTLHVQGRYPNHVWIADVSEIPALFRIFSFKLLVIMDAFSRFPVAARLSLSPPTAEQMVDLFRNALRRHGQPRHIVSDKGRPFRTKQFARELRRQGVQRRFGAIGQHGSIALIERLFKTLKYTFRLRHPFTLSREAMERRLNLVLLTTPTYDPISPSMALLRLRCTSASLPPTCRQSRPCVDARATSPTRRPSMSFI